MNPLRNYRERILVSKSELARKAEVSVLTIDRIEKGYCCHPETKRKILAALDLELSKGNRLFGSKK